MSTVTASASDAVLISPTQLLALQAAEPVVLIDTRDADTYALSAAGCLGLIGFYLCHVLHSRARGLGFAGGLAVLYAMLYGLLSAEDYALLMGALLLFGLLGVFMVLTRRLDWYRAGQGVAQ